MADSSLTPQAPGGSNRTLILAAVLFVVAALAAGVYFLMLSRDEEQPVEIVALSETPGDEALVGDGKVGDLAGFLERNLRPQVRETVSYELQGNKILNFATITPNGTQVSAQEIEIKALDTEHEQPYFADVRVRGMKITPPVPGSLPGGMTSLDLDLVYAYAYDPASKTFTVPAIAIAIKDLANINLTGRLSDVSVMPGSADQAMGSLAGAKIDQFHLILDDQQLLKVLLEAAAKQQGTDMKTLAASALQGLQQMEQGASDPLQKQLIAAGKVLLEKIENVTLTVSAAPAQPFPLAVVVGAAVAAGGMPDLSSLKDLNLTVTAQ